MIIVLEISKCFLLQKHDFIHFLNNQKLLTYFNQTDVTVVKNLVKFIYLNLYIFLSFIDRSLEERSKILKGKQHEESIISIKLI